MESLVFTADLFAFLFAVAIIAGFIDTLAGGGGLLSVPALLMCGLPPLAALATNKLQGSFGVATATVVLLSARRVYWQDIKQLMLASFCGAAMGTLIIQFIDPSVLLFVIPIVLTLLSVYFLLSAKLVKNGGQARISAERYKKWVVPSIGFYDGAIGPGTGSFFAFAGSSLQGHSLVQATAIAKPLNFASNISSLAIFLVAGQVVWKVGLVMMAGQMIGAWLGSKCLFKISPQLLRTLVVTMCGAMLTKYLFM